MSKSSHKCLSLLRRRLKSFYTFSKRHYNDQTTQNVTATVCGCNSPSGQVVGLLLKLSSLIQEVRLHDVTDTNGTALDLKHICSKCRVRSYYGPTQLRYALRGTDIVVMTGGKLPLTDQPLETMFQDNADSTKNLALQCCRMCPRAIIIVAVEPVNSIVPLICEVYRQNSSLNPNKIIGATTLDTVRVRSFIANKQGLSAASVQVPVLAGHSPQTVLPVLSQAKPYGDLYKNEKKETYKELQQQMSLSTNQSSLAFSSGYAVSKLILDVTRGILGLPHKPHCAYVRSDVLPPLKFFASPLLFGPDGVKANLGMPKLNQAEIHLLDNIVPILQTDISMGKGYASAPIVHSAQDIVSNVY